MADPIAVFGCNRHWELAGSARAPCPTQRRRLSTYIGWPPSRVLRASGVRLAAARACWKTHDTIFVCPPSAPLVRGPNSRALRPQDGAASSSNEDSLEPFSAQAVIDRHYYGEHLKSLIGHGIPWGSRPRSIGTEANQARLPPAIPPRGPAPGSPRGRACGPQADPPAARACGSR